jgi:hypothetical protein
MKKVLVYLLFILLVALPLAAQDQHGRIQGKVVTENGEVIVGAKITLASDALIRSLTAVTDDRGRFRFQVLPIGDYAVKVGADGYKSFEQTGIIVRIGSTVTLTVPLTVGEFEEIITITGESPIIDVKSNELGENIGKEMIAKLPVPRFPSDIMSYAAGNVGGDTGTTLGGQDYGANAFKLDGVDVSDPQVGTPWVFVNMETVEEVQIVPIAGANADVGGFTGAAINMVTKSGGNEFSGGFAYYYFDEEFINWNTDDEDIQATTRREALNNDFTGFLGGPIAKDQAWFFGNFGFRKAGQLLGETLSTQKYRNAVAKMSGMATDDLTLTGMYHFDNYLVTGRGSAYYRAPETWTDQTSPNHTYSFDAVWSMDQDNLFTLKFAGWDGRFDYLGRNNNIYVYDKVLDYATGGPYSEYETWRDRNGLQLHYVSYLEQHELKFGVEMHLGSHQEDWRYNQITAANGEYLYRESYETGGAPSWYSEANITNWTLFGQDSFEVNDNLLLNFGLRYERSTYELPDQELLTGNTIEGIGDVKDFNDFAPRVGFVFKIDDDGKSVVRGSYGRYYNKMTSDLFSELNPASADYVYYEWIDNAWLETYRQNLASAYELDDDVSNAYTDAFTLGYEQELFTNFAVGVDYIHRENKNYIVNKEIGQIWAPHTVVAGGVAYNAFAYVSGPESYVITNGDDDFGSKYDGIVIKANKRYSDNWMMNASLTLSHLRGNAAGLADTDWGAVGGNIAYYENPNNQINADGLIAGHRPWVFKAQAVYTFPMEISLAGFFSYYSGARWTPTIELDDGIVGRWGYQTIMAVERGSEALDPVFTANIRLEKSFSIDKYRGSILVDMYNALNNDTVTGVRNGMHLAAFGETTALQNPRYFQLGVRFEF